MIVRRTTGRIVSVVMVLLLPLATWRQQVGAPNIIIFLVGGHRWDTLSILKYPLVKAPTLDRLCRGGVRFDNAFVTNSLCRSRQASVLTGQYSRAHGVKNKLIPWNNTNQTFLGRI